MADIGALIQHAHGLRGRYRRRLLAVWLRRLTRAWRAWRAAARGAAELRALDEHQLRDLGLDRGGIKSAACGRYFAQRTRTARQCGMPCLDISEVSAKGEAIL